MTLEEIKQLAEQYLQKHKDDFDNWKEMAYSKIAYIDAYNQCQEDMADRKYTEEAMLFAFVHGGTKFEENKDASILHKNFKELINSLNKQD